MAKSVTRMGSLIVWLSLVCGGLGADVHAQVPALIRFQGQAVDSQGVPLEGPYTLTFRLYDAATAGTLLWQEPQNNVTLSKGHFSVLLGQQNPFTSVDWSKPCWVSIQVGTQLELSPRQQFTSVPLALRAQVAEGLATSVTTSTITDDANRLVPIGAVILWTGASCPAGYTRLAALDGALLKAGASFSNPTAAGVTELPAHSHTFSGSTSTAGDHKHNLVVEKDTGGETAISSTAPNQPMANGLNYIDSAGSHSHSVSGTTASTGSATVATVLLCQKS